MVFFVDVCSELIMLDIVGGGVVGLVGLGLELLVLFVVDISLFVVWVILVVSV